MCVGSSTLLLNIDVRPVSRSERYALEAKVLFLSRSLWSINSWLHVRRDLLSKES